MPPPGSPIGAPFPQSIVAADFNGDGKLDLAMTSQSDAGVIVLLGNGDGTFTPSSQSFGTGQGPVVLGDFNGDGKADLAELNPGSPVLVLLGNGDGTFTTPSASPAREPNPSSLISGDFNGDGFSDLLISSGNDNTLTVVLAEVTETATASLSSIAPSALGTHLVEASYPGDSNFGASVSGTTSLTALDPTVLTLSAVPAGSTAGQAATLTAVLNPYSFAGQSTNEETVTFYNGGASLGTGVLSGGVATLSVSTLPAGVDALTAMYGGDSALAASTSNTISYTVLGVPTLAFAVGGRMYGAAPFPVAATSHSTGAITNSVLSGPATLAGATVTLTGAGTVVLEASQATTSTFAAATQTATFRVAKASLNLTVSNAARVFGAANPTFSGTVTGAVNGDVLTEMFSTTAIASSIVGSYAIVPSVTGTNVASYTVTATNGSLTIAQAGTATTFALSNKDETLTATVVSLTSGVPTGSVAFYEGQTLVGTSPLVSGVATYTTSSFPAGDVVVSAQYSGDSDFTQSALPPILVLAVTPASSSLTVGQAGSVTDTVSLTPAMGYTGTVQFSCGSLPQNVLCSFQPASVAFTGSNATASVVVTIATGVSAQAAFSPLLPGLGGGGVLAAVVWLPGLFGAVGWRRGRKGRSWSGGSILLVLLLCGLGVTMTACGGGGGSSAPTSSTQTQTPSGAYTVNLVASGSNGLSQTTSVTLTVQ